MKQARRFIGWILGRTPVTAERGTAMVEYAVLIALIAALGIPTVKFVGTSVMNRFDHVAGQMGPEGQPSDAGGDCQGHGNQGDHGNNDGDQEPGNHDPGNQGNGNSNQGNGNGNSNQGQCQDHGNQGDHGNNDGDQEAGNHDPGNQGNGNGNQGNGNGGH